MIMLDNDPAIDPIVQWRAARLRAADDRRRGRTWARVALAVAGGGLVVAWGVGLFAVTIGAPALLGRVLLAVAGLLSLWALAYPRARP